MAPSIQGAIGKEKISRSTSGVGSGRLFVSRPTDEKVALIISARKIEVAGLMAVTEADHEDVSRDSHQGFCNCAGNGQEGSSLADTQRS